MEIASSLYYSTDLRHVHIQNCEKLEMRIEAQDSSDLKLGAPLKDSARKIYTFRSNTNS